jgi:hypothetical protein
MSNFKVGVKIEVSMNKNFIPSYVGAFLSEYSEQPSGRVSLYAVQLEVSGIRAGFFYARELEPRSVIFIEGIRYKHKQSVIDNYLAAKKEVMEGGDLDGHL